LLSDVHLHRFAKPDFAGPPSYLRQAADDDAKACCRILGIACQSSDILMDEFWLHHHGSRAIPSPIPHQAFYTI